MKSNHYWRSKRRHKLLQKKRYLKTCGGWTDEAKYLERYRPQGDRNNGYTYWEMWPNISGRKGFAKRMTNRVIRQHYRELFSGLNPDGDALGEIQAMRNADYEKIYDYWWEVY